jgi:hypothetical protein
VAYHAVMAETRKHQQTAHDPIQAALLAALGEGVRPRTPGSESVSRRGAAEDAPVTASSIVPHATLGAFTFATPPRPSTPAAAASEGEDAKD